MSNAAVQSDFVLPCNCGGIVVCGSFVHADRCDRHVVGTGAARKLERDARRVVAILAAERRRHAA